MCYSAALFSEVKTSRALNKDVSPGVIGPWAEWLKIRRQLILKWRWKQEVCKKLQCQPRPHPWSPHGGGDSSTFLKTKIKGPRKPSIWWNFLMLGFLWTNLPVSCLGGLIKEGSGSWWGRKPLRMQESGGPLGSTSGILNRYSYSKGLKDANIYGLRGTRENCTNNMCLQSSP